MPEVSRDAHLRKVYQDALAAGLDEEGARVAVAIATTEHGYEGGVGDLDRSALGSAGTFQLYFGGGQGDNYAAAHGMSKQQARDYLKRNPHAANEWALNGYLGQAIRRGQAKGLRGADLATYAQDVGQGSEHPERSGANYRTVAMEGGEMDRPPSSFEPPSRVARPAPAAAVGRGQQLFDRIVAAKGDPVGIKIVDPEVETEADETNFMGDPTGKKIKSKSANPAPTYRYEFADGTDVLARTPAGGGLEVVGGTASASVAKTAQAPTRPPGTILGGQTANEQYIVTVQPDGSVTQSPNPNYVAPTPAKPAAPRTVNTSANEQYIVRENPDGTISREPNPNYVPPRADKPVRSTHTVGGRTFTLDADGNVLNSVDLRSPQAVQKEGVDLAQGQQNLEQGALDIAKGRQALLPKAQQILQGHQDTVKYVQGMLERGEIDQANADAYVALSKQAAESALKGFTPFDEMKLRREAETANKRMGTDLLTQRLSSGAGLASSLLSGATSLAGHAMLRPGQTSLGVDPLAQLMPLLEQLQGGADVTPFAKGLLMGGQQGGPPGAQTPLPAGL